MKNAALSLLGRARRTLRRDPDLKSRFTDVYVNNLWRDSESRSGEGSRRGSPCVTDALQALEMAVRNFGIGSVADIPCGDFNWIGAFLDQHPDIAYAGFDIVEPLIQANRERYPRHRFEVLDIAAAVPPKSDLVICKDLLNHLDYEDVRKTLANIRASGATFLLASNNFGYENVELWSGRAGASRHLDITAAPMNYPQPLWATHYLGLWRLEAFPH